MKLTRQHRFAPALAVAAAVLTVPAAAVEVLNAPGAFVFRSTRTANPLGFLNDSLVLGINGVTPNPYTPGTAVGDLTQVWASQSGTNVQLNKIATAVGAFRDSYLREIPYDPLLTGVWDFEISNPQTDPVVLNRATPAFGNVAAVPFAQNMLLQGSGLDLQLSWVVPQFAPGIDRQSIFMFDSNGVFVHQVELALNARSYAFPATLANGQSLQLGETYTMSLDLSDFGPGGRQVASSASYFSFTPTQQALNAFLPSVGDDLVYHFDISIEAPEEILFFDPEVAIGYDFAIGNGNPNFASVLLPDVGDGLFELWLFDGEGNPFDTGAVLAAGVQFNLLDLAAGGVERFRVLGIEESALLDPADFTAFQAGLTFTDVGQFTGTMTPIVTSVVPLPPAVVLMLPGLWMLDRTRRRRQAPTAARLG
ncbi:MAG: hypothetical protein H6978_06415 [Gammaproteobacteria bacterium]|nr:hypothetical protein [Gammaproteobacteria bacterium]